MQVGAHRGWQGRPCLRSPARRIRVMVFRPSKFQEKSARGGMSGRPARALLGTSCHLSLQLLAAGVATMPSLGRTDEPESHLMPNLQPDADLGEDQDAAALPTDSAAKETPPDHDGRDDPSRQDAVPSDASMLDGSDAQRPPLGLRLNDAMHLDYVNML